MNNESFSKAYEGYNPDLDVALFGGELGIALAELEFQRRNEERCGRMLNIESNVLEAPSLHVLN